MIPTDQQINELAATACGWQYYSNVAGYADGWRHEKLDCSVLLHYPYDFPRDYCTDRNALPELYQAVEQKFSIWNFAAELPVYDISGDACLIAYRVLTLSAREITIAALKALNVWPDDFETPTESTSC